MLLPNKSARTGSEDAGSISVHDYPRQMRGRNHNSQADTSASSLYLLHVHAQDDGIQVDALEGHVPVHGRHRKGGALDDIVFANLKELASVGDAAHSRQQLLIGKGVQRHVDAAAIGLQGAGRCVTTKGLQQAVPALLCSAHA